MHYFQSNSIDVRFELSRVFNTALISSEIDHGKETFQEFFLSLISAISLYGSNQANKPVDYVSIGLLMCNMVAVNSGSSFSSLISVLFFLQVHFLLLLIL